MKEGIIYMYTSPSNKVYVGQTTRPEQRKKQHRNHSLRNSGGCKYFYKAVKKYGFENFKYDILHTAIDETIDGLKEKLNFWERFYISEYKSNDSRYGYNLTAGGEGVSLGHIVTKETRRKISESMKGHVAWNKEKPHTEETRQKISEANKGKHSTEELRKKIIESLKGKPAWNKGKPYPHPKLKWLTETGEIREMTIQNQRKCHPNWFQVI